MPAPHQSSRDDDDAPAGVRGSGDGAMTGGSAGAVTDVQTVAAEAFDLLDTGRQISPFSSRLPRFDLDDAYRVTAAVRQMRETRGETPLGRKIGFTNRTIWDEYQIGAPMWGYIYDRTVHDLADMEGTVSLAGLAEPRIEPEIVFGLAAAPAPGMDERGHDWLGSLATLRIDLRRDGTVVDQGRASNVLGGPLSALRHLVEVLASDPVNPPLTAGEIVTTGTLTRAFPVAPGETWATELTGVALDGIAIRFA